MTKERTFVFKLRHPICNTITFTNDPKKAEKYRQDGWSITRCIGMVLKNGKVYKHSSN